MSTPALAPATWPVTYRRKIRFSDVDTQGIVFNPNYSRYVADTITDFFDAVGVTWETFLEASGRVVIDARLVQIVVDSETLRPKPVPGFFLDAVREVQTDLPRS